MKRVLSFLVLASLVGACASVEAPAADSTAADLHGGSICPPLEYPHAVPNEVYFRRFESDEKAADYMTKLVATGQLAPFSGGDATFREISQDPRLVRLVGEVFDGYRRVFPDATAGLTTPPRIAIIESSIVNAFALGTGFPEDASANGDQAPWLFLVHTALINHGGTDSELRGLFAHELAHLILRNGDPVVRSAIRAVYRVPGSENGILGESQADDPTLSAHVEDIRKRQDRVGAVPKLGLPVISELGSYAKIFDLLGNVAAQSTPQPSDACVAASKTKATLETAQVALLPGQDNGDFTPLTPNAAQAENLEALSATLEDELLACTAPLTAPPATSTIADMLADVNHLPPTAVDPASPDHAKLVSLMLEAEGAADAKEPASRSLMARLLDAQVTIRSELDTLQQDPRFPIDDIRVYDYEEDADDASVRILSAIGDDPRGIAQFLANALMTPAARTTCLEDIASGKKIAYGRFVDPHPTTCWRYYHADQLAKALASCAPSTSTRLPQGSNVPSAADRPSKDLIEKGYGTGPR